MDYITKNTLFFIFLFFAFLQIGFGQPEIEWERSFGGSGDDNAEAIQQTIDGGYIIAGTTRSSDGDITFTNGGADYWVIKLNRNGDLEWKKNYGGSRIESLASIQQTNDEGYIVAGYTFSTDGDVGNNNGETDYWVVKLDNNGNLEWEKNYGGSSYDNLNSIKQTIDEGYIIAGSSFSSDGDVGANYGNGANYYWIIKLNNKGDLEWEKNYGGDGGERANSIQQTSDGGYVIAGESRSSNGDVNNNNGDWDYWIIKLDNNGNLEWEKNYGGSKSENAFSIQQTSDGGYIVTGDTFSSDGDVSENKGKSDYWIVKLNDKGDLEWEKSYGGSKFEKSSSIQQINDEEYIIAGFAESIDGDISNNKGITNYWIIKLDNKGDLIWEKTYGGSYIDVPSSIQQTNDKGYIIAGSSRSSDGDLTGNYGERDYWIVKLAPNCQTIDSLALVDLYNATNGPNWSPIKWDLIQPMSEWDGLILNANGCAQILELQSNNLTGSLPASIGNLSQLENLALWDNQLTGSIPTSIGNLTNLKYFSIYNNQLTGGIPAEVGELNNLIWLSLAGNTNLGGAIPSSLGNLTNLEGCYLSECNLSGTIPDSLQNLIFLKEFSVASNLNLTGSIPSWISNFTQLERLLLFGNSFTGKIPTSLTELPNLTHLYLHENNLSGCFPDAFSKFCSWTNQGDDIDNAGYNFKVNRALPWSGDLTNFCSGTSQIGATCDDGNANTSSSVIDENCDCVEEVVGETCRSRDSLNLVDLYNATNGPNWSPIKWDLTQPISTWEGLTLNEDGCVKSIFLPNNNVTDSLPKSIGNLRQLEELYLFGNQLSGVIPTSIGNLSNLVWLSLYSNNLSGDIPPELGNLVNLEILKLAGNTLIGSIPAELGNLSNLTRLLCGRNLFTGNIPPELGDLSSLITLDFSDNQITGSIPTKFEKLSKLETLNIENNNLSGDIPKEIENIQTLEKIFLKNNNLSGSIPFEISNLINLSYLDLTSNNLTGNIPSGLGDLSQLETLALSNNQLSGCIPDDLSRFCALGQEDYNIFDFLGDGYNFTNNPMLPWSGDSLWCNNESQIGAPCDDGNPDTNNDKITADCECKGEVIETCRSRDSLALVALYNATDGENWFPKKWDLSQPMTSWDGLPFFNSEGCITYLGLNNNNLTGKIPTEIGNLLNLEILSLDGNNLTGEIPKEIGRLSNLTTLSLNRNNLNSTIPIEIGNLLNLRELSLIGASFKNKKK